MAADGSPAVLVVDDDESIRAMVARVLERERFRVDSARDGHEAIQKISSNDYATIVLDLMMPRVDGLGVLRHLEELHATGEPPKVIVMTANLHGATDARRARPTFRVLSKPFEIRELISHVREAVERPAAAPEGGTALDASATG